MIFGCEIEEGQVTTSQVMRWVPAEILMWLELDSFKVPMLAVDRASRVHRCVSISKNYARSTVHGPQFPWCLAHRVRPSLIAESVAAAGAKWLDDVVAFPFSLTLALRKPYCFRILLWGEEPLRSEIE